MFDETKRERRLRVDREKQEEKKRIKKEYLALGKPVVSTGFGQVQEYRDVIYEAQSPMEFAAAIKRALAEDNAERIAARRKMVLHDSWESKAQLVLEEFL